MRKNFQEAGEKKSGKVYRKTSFTGDYIHPDRQCHYILCDEHYPGGPFNKEKATSAEAQKVLEERYNLDKPIPEQYVIYMNNLLHGDWGVSLHSGRDIWGRDFFPF